MKKQLLTVLVMVTTSLPIYAGVGGVGGSTEFTQISNNVQLMNSYAKQVLQYTRQALQLEAELKALINNPLSLLGPDVGNLINQVGELMSAGNAIGKNVAQIDKNFADTFKNTQARSLSDNFTRWHQTSTDTLQAAMKAAGLNRDHYQSDSDALSALYDNAQTSSGTTDAVQALSKMTAFQVQQLMKLQELIATQNLAAGTYMAEQTTQQSGVRERAKSIMGPGNIPMPAPGQSIGGI